MTTTTIPAQTTHEARRRFYDLYGERIGGATWPDVQRYIDRPMAEPITVEGWRTVAGEVRDSTRAAIGKPAEAPPVAPAARADDAPQLGFRFTTRARIGDVEGDLAITAERLKDLVLTVRQLGNVPAISLVSDAAQMTTPDGRPICRKHGVPMKAREKQGDIWHSHNVGSEGDPCYCKGYAGPDSPGWDR